LNKNSNYFETTFENKNLLFSRHISIIRVPFLFSSRNNSCTRLLLLAHNLSTAVHIIRHLLPQSPWDQIIILSKTALGVWMMTGHDAYISDTSFDYFLWIMVWHVSFSIRLFTCVLDDDYLMAAYLIIQQTIVYHLNNMVMFTLLYVLTSSWLYHLFSVWLSCFFRNTSNVVYRFLTIFENKMYNYLYELMFYFFHYSLRRSQFIKLAFHLKRNSAHRHNWNT